MEKERILSLAGLTLFLLGSAIQISVMVLILARPFVFGYSGLDYFLADFVPIAVIGTGLFLMVSALARSRKKADLYFVSSNIVMVGFSFLAIGFYLFFWLSSTGYFGCPSNGVCWGYLFTPVLGMLFLDAGAFLLSYSIRNRKSLTSTG